MRRSFLAAAALAAFATPAAAETAIEKDIRNHLQTSGAWQAIYENATGGSADKASLKAVRFEGSAVAMPIRLDLPQRPFRPTVLEDSILQNCSDLPQKMDFRISESKTESTTFTWNETVSLGVEVKWETGLPLIGGAETKGSVSSATSFGKSKTDSRTLTWELDVPTDLQPMTAQPVQFVVEEYQLNSVPFEMDILYRGPVETVNTVANPSRGYMIKSAMRGNYCLDVFRNKTKGGNPLVGLWKCHGGDNQLWEWSGKRLRSVAGNQCLDINKRRKRKGARLIAYDCHDRWNQQFERKSGHLVTPETGRCLDIRGAKASNGADVITWDCHGGANQKWSFAPALDQRTAGARIEEYMGEDERIVTIRGVVDIQAGVNAQVRWAGPSGSPPPCAT